MWWGPRVMTGETGWEKEAKGLSHGREWQGGLPSFEES